RDRNVTGVQTCALPIFAEGSGALRVFRADNCRSTMSSAPSRRSIPSPLMLYRVRMRVFLATERRASARRLPRLRAGSRTNNEAHLLGRWGTSKGGNRYAEDFFAVGVSSFVGACR